MIENNNLNEEQLTKVAGGNNPKQVAYNVDKDFFLDIDQAIKIIMEDPNYNAQSKQFIETLVHAKELVTVQKKEEAFRLLDEVMKTADRYFDKKTVPSIYYWVSEAMIYL